MDNLSLTYPSRLITKIKTGEFTLLTDYPEDRGGNNIVMNPWRVFLSGLLACEGVNLAKYCREHNVDYSQVKIELEPHVIDSKTDEFPEYHIKVELPKDFPQEHIEPMVAFFTNCPVANHLTKLKPILKTFINNELVSTINRK